MPYSEAQKEATARYNKKAYDRINLVVPKGKRALIADFAKSKGKSLNRFINDAIDYQMTQEEYDREAQGCADTDSSRAEDDTACEMT